MAMRAESITFSPDARQGHGVIAGLPVRCLSAAMHMRTHTGYELQDKDRQDLRRLQERFDVDYPEDPVQLQQRGTRVPPNVACTPATPAPNNRGQRLGLGAFLGELVLSLTLPASRSHHPHQGAS
jgi:hypothetical protein